MAVPDLGAFVPWMPSLTGIINVAIVLGILVIAIIMFFWLTGRWKRPIKYEADILEKIGNHYRARKGWVFFKRVTGEVGYYVEKRKVALDINQAFLTEKGKSKFYLLKIEDRYVPLSLHEFMEMRKKKGAKPVKVKIHKFLATSLLDEYEKAQSESILHNAKKYRWRDKLGPLLMIGLPIFALIVIFFIAAWVTRGMGEVTSELTGLKGSFDAVASSMGANAKAIEALAERWGGSVAPPPG